MSFRHLNAIVTFKESKSKDGEQIKVVHYPLYHEVVSFGHF